MGELLSIKWDTGYMTISMDDFFPCSAVRLKKLLKVVDLDWEHRDELREKITVYFKEQIPVSKEDAKKWANSYVDLQTATAELSRALAAKKFSNGLPMKPDDVSNAKERLRELKARQAQAKTTYSRGVRKWEQFKALYKLMGGNPDEH